MVKPENEGHSQLPPKTIGVLNYFAPLVQIWLSYFEWFTSYGVEKLKKFYFLV